MSLTVLGANGFIGYNYVGRYLHAGSEKIIAVGNNFTHYYPSNTMCVNYHEFFDVIKYNHTEEQVIIYAVGSFSSRSSMGEMYQGVEKEKELLLKVLSKLQTSKIDKARLVFLSSGGAVYGNTSKPHSESGPVTPTTPYGVGKLELENYVKLNFNQCGYKTLIVRPSNVYGPHQSGSQGQGVIPIFIERVLAGLPIKIFQSGNLLKDYIFISDFCECLRQLVNNKAHGIYNVGSGFRYSALDIANLLRVHLDSKVKIDTEINDMMDVLGYELDLSKMNSKIDYRPGTELTVGVQETIKWYRSYHV